MVIISGLFALSYLFTVGALVMAPKDRLSDSERRIVAPVLTWFFLTGVLLVAPYL